MKERNLDLVPRAEETREKTGLFPILSSSN